MRTPDVSAKPRTAILSAAALGLALSAFVLAQGQPPTTGGRQARPPRQMVGGGPNDRPAVDDAAAKRGRTMWATSCASCHGEDARGTGKGANLIRSELVLHDRDGNLLGPFLEKGHGGTPAVAGDQVYDLANFLRERVNDSLRGSPLFVVRNVLTGDPKAGAVFFSGPGGCTACHSATGDLKGIGAKYEPVDLQQRMVFPRAGQGRGAPTTASRATTTVTVTPSSGPTVSGLLIESNDFTVTLREASGAYRTFTRGPTLKVTKTDPLAAHRTLLDELTDKTMHDLVAYLETLK